MAWHEEDENGYHCISGKKLMKKFTKSKENQFVIHNFDFFYVIIEKAIVLN